MIEINNLIECLDYVQDIDLVIFDLDDTLINEIDYIKGGFDAIAEGFPEIKNCSHKLLQSFERKEKPIDTVLGEEYLLNKEKLAKAIYLYRNHKPNITFAGDAKEVLITLRSKGKKLGVITDGRIDGQQSKVDAIKLEDYVDKIIITDSLGGIEFRKPNPKAYQMMQEFFNMPFSRMMYIGDNINKDFIAPEKLGMQSIHYINQQGIYNI